MSGIGLNHWCAAWPEDLKELARNLDALILYSNNLEHRIERADSADDAWRLIADLQFYREQLQRTARKFRLMESRWNEQRFIGYRK